MITPTQSPCVTSGGLPIWHSSPSPSSSPCLTSNLSLSTLNVMIGHFLPHNQVSPLLAPQAPQSPKVLIKDMDQLRIVYMTYGHHKSETDLSVHRIDQALMLYVPLFTFVLGLLLCSINLSLSIAGHYQSPSSLASPLLPCHCRTSSSSSLSSFADCYSLLTSNHADVTSAPWCAPQVCATIAPVSRVSCTLCSTPRLSSLACGHMFSWTFSCFRIYSLAIRMFSPFFLYLRPVAPFFSFHIVSFVIGV